MKNSLTPAGIEPATFRFVAQHLNHCATAVPNTRVSQSYTVPSFPGTATGHFLHNVHVGCGTLPVPIQITVVRGGGAFHRSGDVGWG